MERELADDPWQTVRRRSLLLLTPPHLIPQVFCGDPHFTLGTSYHSSLTTHHSSSPHHISLYHFTIHLHMRQVLRGDAQLRSMLKELRPNTRRPRHAAGKGYNAGGKAGSLWGDLIWGELMGGGASSPNRRRQATIGRQATRGALGGGEGWGEGWGSKLRSSCNAYVFVLNPDGKFRTVWNVFMALLICYSGVMVPFEIAFEGSMIAQMGSSGWYTWEICNLVIDCLFIFDIFLSFRTAYAGPEGQAVTDTAAIAINYLRGAFTLDLLGSFPINLILVMAGVEQLGVDDDDTNSAATRLNRQLRLLRIFKLNRLLRLSKLRSRLKYMEVMLQPCTTQPSRLLLATPPLPLFIFLIHPTPPNSADVAGLQPVRLACLQADGVDDLLLPLDGVQLVVCL